MAFVLKQALEFNKFTMGLATAGLAYAATIGSEPIHSTVSIYVKVLSTGTVVAFAVAILFGIFVMGRAAKIDAAENDRVNDDIMKLLGKLHSITLIVGLALAGCLMLNKIWKFV